MILEYLRQFAAVTLLACVLGALWWGMGWVIANYY